MGYTLTSYEPVHKILERPEVPAHLVDQEIDRLLEEQSTYHDSERDTVRFGDYLILTTTNALVAGSPMPMLEMHEGFYRAIGQDMPIVFDDALIGMKVGETKSIDIEVGPRLLADEEPSHLTIDATINKILERESPELTDDYIAETFPPAKNADEFRAQVAHSFTPNPIAKSDPQFEAIVATELGNRLVEEIHASDVPKGDDLANFRITCAIDALADHLGMDVDDAEMVDLIPADTADQRRQIYEHFEKQGQLDELKANIRREKTLKWLVSESTVDYE